MSPATILRKAADGYRTGQIGWGCGWFLDPRTGCRCALGAIAWAADPRDADGNPWFTDPTVRGEATLAAFHLADYLVDVHGVPRCITDGEFDPIETVGGWNDASDVTDVIAALDGAADTYRSGA